MAAPERWWVVYDPSQRQEPGHPNSQVINSVSKPQGHEFVYGPYATKAQAQARLAQIQSPITPPNPVNLVSPLSDLGKIGHWVGDAVLHITDGAMWRSLGWLALGMLLVVGGIYLWFRTSSTYAGLESAALGTVKAL